MFTSKGGLTWRGSTARWWLFRVTEGSWEAFLLLSLSHVVTPAHFKPLASALVLFYPRLTQSLGECRRVCCLFCTVGRDAEIQLLFPTWKRGAKTFFYLAAGLIFTAKQQLAQGLVTRTRTFDGRTVSLSLHALGMNLFSSR